MAYNILLTSLYDAGENEAIQYFHARDGYREYYCEAALTVEASTKYVLAQYPVDAIVTIGRKLTFDEGDDDRIIELSQGKDFYLADVKDLSTYSLFRYRIAQYIDELRIEQQEIMETLMPEEQEKVTAFIRGYCQRDLHLKSNRLFDDLSENPEAYAEFCQALREAVPEAAAEPDRYMTWVKNFLYISLRDSSKLVPLKENDDVKVRFIPTDLVEGDRLPLENMMQVVRAFSDEYEGEVNLYVALNNDDLTDNYVLLNVLDLVKTMPSSNVNVRSIFTTSHASRELAGEIRNDTEVFDISGLTAAARAFLQYGKADMIVDFWERCGAHNERVEDMIYSMRRIDMGISLCNIREIEKGIEELRDLFANGSDLGGDDYHSRLYNIISESIVRDYGPLLKGTEIEFIDLVKWAADKKFYQQTLTLIESRAPKAFVKHGIFYYCNDESEVRDATEVFARIRNSLKPYELYMMDDVDHYFIKFYGRRSHRRGRGDAQRNYTAYRMHELTNTNPDRITAHTACTDMQNLENLLYAYYHIGDVRNMTNHAEDRNDEDKRLIVDQKDIPFRMTQIRESIDFFIMNYEKAIEDIGDRKYNVIHIPPYEIKSCAKRSQDEERSESGKFKNR